MNNKKCKLFLRVSFAIFAISVIAVISSLVISYYQIKSDFANDSIQATKEFGWALAFGIIMIFPFLGSELSFIRSVYKILKDEPTGYVKICYIISSCIALLAVSFQLLASVGLISFIGEGGNNRMAEILLFTQGPAFITSFIFGSISIKHNDE